MERIKSRILAVLGTMTAYALIIPVWVAYLFGRVKIKWSPGAKQAWKNGGVLVIANHPSLIETIVLPALFWHPSWLRNQKQIPWSVSDRYLFGNRPWIYNAFRCIVVSREKDKKHKESNRLNFQAIKTTLRRISSGRIVILYPEGGRTCKGDSFWSHGGRRVKRFDAGLIQRAVKLGHTVIPVWISHGDVTEPESFFVGYKKLFFGPKFLVHFGQPLSTRERELDEQVIAEAMLKTGE